MSQIKTHQPTAKDYKDGRTKQSFKDETDINKILQRANRTGTISHLNKHEARYGEFAHFDFFEAQLKLAEGRTIFDDLPAEVRYEFGQSPGAFFDYVNDPKNKDDLARLLPGLAEPGRQLTDTRGNIPADEADRVAENTPADPPADPPADSPGPPTNPSEPPPDDSSAAT